MVSGETDESGFSRGSINFGVLHEAWHRLGDRLVVGIGAKEEPSVVEVTSSSEKREGGCECREGS